MLIALIAVPAHPMLLLLAFILFRVFDIAKPFPVSWFDQHIHGGMGIMLDDVMAGIYTLICLQIIGLFFR
jgi:phosphatidylglycerophosphatase A